MDAEGLANTSYGNDDVLILGMEVVILLWNERCGLAFN